MSSIITTPTLTRIFLDTFAFVLTWFFTDSPFTTTPLESCWTIANIWRTTSSTVHALWVTNWLCTKTTFPALSTNTVSIFITVPMVIAKSVTTRINSNFNTILPENRNDEILGPFALVPDSSVVKKDHFFHERKIIFFKANCPFYSSCFRDY